LSAFNPPPRICPACAAENLPLATICRACGTDLRFAPSATGGRRHVGLTGAVVAIAIVALIAAVGLELSRAGAAHPELGSRPFEPIAARPSLPPATPAPASSSPPANLIKVGQPVEVAGVETHTVLRVEDWSGPTPPGTGERYLAVEIQVATMPGKTVHFDQLYYTVQNAAGILRNAPQIGRQPALAYGILGPGESVIGWISFLVPDPGPFVLEYHFPLGSNGQTADEAVALEPILPPSPEPVVPANPSPGSSGVPNLGYPTALSSSNYSGYGAQLPGKSISTVAGSWVQPAVKCSGKETSVVAIWVGIDDGGLHNLEQIGTEALCHSGSSRPAYIAWYEMYPLAQVPVTDVMPGDHFTASVTKRGDIWTLAIKDTSTGDGFSTDQTRASAAIQALWVVEAPSRIQSDGKLQVLPLTSFGRITLTGCSAVAGGTRRAISNARWAHYRFDMRTSSNTPKAITGALTQAGSSFSSSWRHH
jgi:Peptidase A4 family